MELEHVLIVIGAIFIVGLVLLLFVPKLVALFVASIIAFFFLGLGLGVNLHIGGDKIHAKKKGK